MITLALSISPLEKQSRARKEETMIGSNSLGLWLIYQRGFFSLLEGKIYLKDLEILKYLSESFPVLFMIFRPVYILILVARHPPSTVYLSQNSQ